MENSEKIKVKINIAGNEFTVISEDSESYTLTVAEEVNNKISDIRKNNMGMSLSSAIILAALDFCDSMKKSEKDADNFRKQIKEYLTEAAKNETLTEQLKKENERLKKDIQTYRQRLSDEIKSENNDASPLSSAVKAVQKAVSVSDVEEAAEDDTEFFDMENKD